MITFSMCIKAIKRVLRQLHSYFRIKCGMKMLEKMLDIYQGKNWHVVDMGTVLYRNRSQVSGHAHRNWDSEYVMQAMNIRVHVWLSDIVQLQITIGHQRKCNQQSLRLSCRQRTSRHLQACSCCITHVDSVCWGRKVICQAQLHRKVADISQAEKTSWW